MQNYYFLCTPLYHFEGNQLVWDPELQKTWLKVVNALEKSGIKIVVALRDLDQTKSGDWLRKKEFKLIENAKGVVVIIGNTPLTYAEVGYAYGLGKKIYGLRTENFTAMPKKIRDWFESILNATYDTPEKLTKALT